MQSEDRAHQHRRAGARAADHAQDLAAAHVEIEAFVHDLFAEAVDQAAHGDDRFAVIGIRDSGFGIRHGKPSPGRTWMPADFAFPNPESRIPNPCSIVTTRSEEPPSAPQSLMPISYPV